ncbi:MAG: FAD-dependent oxidoreductase [Gammaproteobacteria bacterium]|jgi:NADPH-dependent 2,4-dienoyl-CoA reductase/sulfur reductase-like enzyme|nr:FAD-dependent oxidoreductase [Gammaproteobacteria bacterium]MBT3723774.1 FAD-dependent oxidoreductase [Gammaproteobacteria bacterium]MBT4196432.1 FAD-dependent oxidoreductase [Gammaproteobacteria bacterium]MBT4448147.1 FAD-dependent oxidoreductase [Gammaproteobacteria bacterium]MBT4862438.1 FAD-dependent oxidoreductase [Gammaproteobacteria bacterium]
MKTHYSLVIIGAGPAGLSAAVIAANHGIDVALLDEQEAPGGQIYRAMESIPPERAKLLGSEYLHGKNLVSEIRNSNVDYFSGTQVWSLNDKREIGLLHDDKAIMITADQVILASGAIERPVPFPGWTLPGVMNAGAGQILLKSHGIVPADGVVLAGSGPLLLLLAWQYHHAGVNIKSILDLTPMQNHLRALPHLPRALLAGHYLSKGLAYKKDLKQAGIGTLHNVSDLIARGKTQLNTVSFLHKGQLKSIETDLLLIHFGVIPHTQLSRAAGCFHEWNSSQQCWTPKLSKWGSSSIDGILIAGDGAGIGGARTAEHAGRLAALQVLYKLEKITRLERKQLARNDRKWMREERHIRPFLEAFFHIPGKLLRVPDDDTIVCRCEEITAGEIRSAVSIGHSDNNQVKFLTRCGMGLCQGRQCNEAVSHIIATANNENKPQQHYRARPPVTPLTLGQLATLFPQELE